VSAYELARPTHAHGSTGTFAVSATSSVQEITVPRTLTHATFVVTGASGENGQNGIPWGTGGAAGVGQRITATIQYGHGIVAGDVLELIPGRRGSREDATRPLAGGRAGAASLTDGTDGGWGGGGSGVYNRTRHRWLVVAGGGAGGGGVATFEPTGRAGGNAGMSGTSSRLPGHGGLAGASCPETSVDAARLRGGAGGNAMNGRSNGGGGGGGGGCYGGAGGTAGAVQGAGGGGGGGRSWNAATARDVSVAPAPAGDGSVEARMTVHRQPPPQIVSPSRIVLTVGAAANFDVVSVGSPPPHLTFDGSFPPGLTMRVPLFSGRGELRGTPAAGSEGEYRIYVVARNDWGADPQMLRIVVEPSS
jgi:hypothetical protein